MSRVEAARSIPHWPALLDEGLASAYLGVSEPTFRAITARAKLPPVDLGCRVTRWRRSDLDALVDKLPARGSSSDVETLAGPDPAEEALARAARRRR